MRKNLLALSIAAMVGGLSGAANAAVITNAAAVAPAPATILEPTTTGVGHILAVPYFTTQGTNATLLNIVNTDTVNGKAVKLRFRGASNSDDVFDISIFMSPGDVWAANVSANGDLSTLSTTDTTCTLPSKADIESLGGRFKTGRVNAGSAAQTREGYVEILNMADIPPGTGAAGANSALYTAIKHTAAGVAPCTAAVMDAQSVDLASLAAATARGYSYPTGGLMANWTIVNLADKASFSGEATAIRANVAAGGVAGSGNIVFFPQTTDAPVAAAVPGYTADPLLLSAGFAGQVANYDFPDLSTPYITAAGVLVAPGQQATDLGAAFATASVTNEFLTGGAAQFATDWVFSSPTRRYAVALDYAAPVGGGRLLFNGLVGTQYAAGNTTLSADGLQACVTPGALRGYDREEASKTTFVISPEAALRLCGETSVLSFNTTGSKVLGATLAQRDIATGYADGWLRINTPGVVAAGLPIIGYAASKAQGVNLGGTWNHRTSR